MEKKERSPRNKTIVLTPEDEALYLGRCLSPGAPFVSDSVINGNCIEALAALPDGFAGLLIADPPYNLDKNYAETRFARMNTGDYRAFTERWLNAVLPKLRKDASVYVCCDWRSGMVIGPLLEERLHLRGRITWQREKGRGAAKNWKSACEDIWFCTVSDDYHFDRSAVRLRRRVIAPYRADGKPKGRISVGVLKLLGDLFAWLSNMQSSLFVAVCGVIVLLLNLFYLAICLEQSSHSRKKVQR